MRCLARNKIPFFFANLSKIKEIRDEYGNLTGESALIYTKPRMLFANIAPPSGDASADAFGTNIVYDRIVIMDMPCPINVDSVLWIDHFPALEDDGSLSVDENGEPITKPDYVVRRVAESLNFVRIAIERVAAGG